MKKWLLLIIALIAIPIAVYSFGSNGGVAIATFYNNLVSGGTYNNVQGAIDELYSNITAMATSAGVSDEAYNESSWDGIIVLAPSKNAVRDKIESLSTVYQSLEATLTDIADGTITEDLVNTANPWADNEVSDTLTIGASSTVANGALDTDLQTWAGVTSSANGRSLVSAADYAAMKVLLGLTVGSDIQAYDADLVDLADGSLTGSKIGDGIDDDYVSFDDTDSLWTATKIGPALEELNDSINAGAPNGTGAKVHWSQLLGVPAGFADGTDDGSGGSSTFAALTDMTVNSSTTGVVIWEGTTGRVLKWGDSGTFLKSDGTWATPSGSGDMLAASYPHIVAIEALTHTDGNIIVGDGSTWVAESGATARTSLGLAIGTNVQAWDAQLDDIADGTLAGDFVNTAYPWADNEVANDLTISGGTINNSIIGGSVAAAGTFTTLSAGATGFSVDADGDVICKSLSISQSTASAGGWMGYEDGDNGTNTFTWLVPAAITANRTFQMTDTDPTGTQVMAGTLSDSTITLSWVTPLTSASIDTSAELASILGDEIGTGYVLFSGALGSPGSIPAYFTVLHTSSGAEFKGQVYAQEIDDGNSSTSDTIDWTTGNNHKSTMTGNCTYTFTAPSGPAHLTLRCIADGTLRTITWPSSVKWGSAGAPAMTSTNGYWDVICLYYDGTNYSATYSQGYN